MKANCITFYEFGNPHDVLKVEQKHIQSPEKREILVRMKARPINPSDLIPIKGTYSHRISLPNIPGYEGVGIVEEVGQLVSQELIGKRVLPLRGEGTWQEYVKTSADLAVPIPNTINDFIASQLYINPLTAWVVSTEILKLKPRDVLLVNACGSSLGRIFAQLSKIIGFQLIAVVRNNRHTEDLFQLGASYVINTSEESLHHTVKELTNGFGVTAAIDSAGGVDGTELSFCVRTGGVLLTLGLLSGRPINWKEIPRRTNVTVKMFHLRHWNQLMSVQVWQETFHRLISFVNDKQLELMMPDSYYDLSKIKEATHVAECSKRNPGKVVLTS